MRVMRALMMGVDDGRAWNHENKISRRNVPFSPGEHYL